MKHLMKCTQSDSITALSLHYYGVNRGCMSPARWVDCNRNATLSAWASQPQNIHQVYPDNPFRSIDMLMTRLVAWNCHRAHIVQFDFVGLFQAPHFHPRFVAQYCPASSCDISRSYASNSTFLTLHCHCPFFSHK